MASQISINYFSITSHQGLNHQYMLKVPFHRQTTTSFRSLVRASKPQSEETNTAGDKATVDSQEDLRYLLKLGAGSVAGAAAIKYGSVVFPELTSPNLIQALFMIFAPVIVVVVLLVKQSRVD